MANSPPRLKIAERSDAQLLDDLCIELRHVGCRDYGLPDGEVVVAHIQEVVAIHEELRRRGVDCNARLLNLTEETKWQMSALLGDCLAYPKQLPFVRELDGIRRSLRCQLCAKAERPVDARLFWFCDTCVRQVVDAVRLRAPLKGVVLFRTYNTECRCAHADAETVLATDCCIEELTGVCEQCLTDELERRNAV